jgi:hypothetical protein
MTPPLRSLGVRAFRSRDRNTGKEVPAMPVPIVDIRLEEDEVFINLRGDDSDDEARCRGA